MRSGFASVGRVLARPIAMVVVLAAVLGLPALASAHIERPSYWPDPAPEQLPGGTTAGGEVPDARSLASAKTGAGPGKVRVVCQGTKGKRSLALARKSINSAVKKGYKLRPSQPTIKVSKAKGQRLLRMNRTFAKRCRFDNVQDAINASGNNDRVVVMPGRYTEPKSRQAPTNDPRCEDLTQQDASGNETPSYEYQATCPNDQNLIYVQGRAIKGDPQPPREDRFKIPEEELGECVRCNLQIEGSGVKPTDVVMDAGKNYDNPKPAAAKPGGDKPGSFCAENEGECYAKHVVLRADRADGFVGRNFLMRGGLEHGFYTEETDGTLLDKVKFFWNADYGHLSFTSDHSLIKNCDGLGAGDAVLYPGAAPETGAQKDDEDYPGPERYNTTVRKCDMRGSALGYSGSMGNAVRITDNEIYGNATGIASDTLSASGHPGYPADSSLIDNNRIYSNNFDVYDENSPVAALVGVPIGTGVLYAGMNDAKVHDNAIFDNWRDGVMLFSVPDLFASGGGAEGEIYSPEKIPCLNQDSTGVRTSCANSFYDNSMGRPPSGFKKSSAVGMFGNEFSPNTQRRQPNGNDFWWDEGGSTAWSTNIVENCWWDNTGPDGTAESVTGSGAGTPPDDLPDCAGGTDPSSSVGIGDQAKLLMLISCADGPGSPGCPWFDPNPKPGSDEAGRASAPDAKANRSAKLPEAKGLINAYGDPTG
ncbi:hypothetical protein HJD18_02865 [Thermoleophilia bacterium SCSIO 60948]|nr:hypothetical protein HJD18_02865 [Thermoleophilia bacterium SCSIO 60948]